MTAIVPERPHAGLTETIALRRFGSAGDAADLVAFLLSDESSVLTGTVREVRSPIFAGAP
jgi:NAD(P)-dependent dehydrogenase (short-subunit alcohol dehydrogenase family)